VVYHATGIRRLWFDLLILLASVIFFGRFTYMLFGISLGISVPTGIE